MKIFSLAIFALIAVSSARAEDKPLMQEVWKEVLRKGTKGVEAAKNIGKPRVVAKGAKPEIILKKDQIWIDGKLLQIDQPLDLWKKNVPGKSRCDSKPPRILCVWDNLGLQILTQSVVNTSVFEFKIYVNREKREPWLVTTWPDGTPAEEPKDTRPKHAFPGYLELDGYGIDAKSQFWEIRAGSDPWRELRCGLRDCAHPHGAFSDTASLYLRLNSPTDHGNVYEFTISGREEPPPQNAQPKK